MTGFFLAISRKSSRKKQRDILLKEKTRRKTKKKPYFCNEIGLNLGGEGGIRIMFLNFYAVKYG